ncbi:hypothetical protein ACFL47_10705, partial [Candidatus Latescibacterota bacterium]
TVNDFSLRSGKHAVLAHHKRAAFRWVPYVGTVTEAKKEQTVVVTFILPVDDDKDAGRIARSASMVSDNSGNVTVSFTKSSVTHTYKFVRDGINLVLEK